LIYIGWILHKNGIQQKIQYRIPKGKIAYSDLNTPGKTMFSKRYKITGKPDYIVNNNNRFIPVEIKSGYYTQPQKNHILQLATYCQLIEENYGTFTPYGILVYKNQDFKIPFNPSLRFELESVLSRMKKEIKSKNVSLNHNDPRKCRHCSMRVYCKDKLA